MAQHKVSVRFELDDRIFKNRLRNAQNDLKKMNSELSKSASLQGKLKSSTDMVDRAGMKQSKGIKQQTSELKRYNNELRRTSKQQMIADRAKGGISRMGAGIGGSIAGLAGGYLGATALIGAGGAAFRNSAQLEDKFGITANLLNVNKDSAEFKTAQVEIKQIAQQTKADLFDTIDAYNEALSANMESDVAQAVARQSGVLATGNAEIQADTAGSALISLANTYGLGAGDLKDLGNEITGLLDVAAGNAGSLVNNISQFSQTGKSLGIGRQEQFAAYAALTNQGFSAEESAVRLNAFFTKLLTGSKGGKKDPTLQKLGITSAFVQEKGLGKTLDKLTQSLGEFAPEEQATMLQKLFGEIRAGQGAALLQSLGSEGLGDLTGKIQFAVETDKASQNFERNADNMSVKMTETENNFRILGDAIMTSEHSFGLIKGTLDLVNAGLTDLIGSIQAFEKEAIEKQNEQESRAARLQNEEISQGAIRASQKILSEKDLNAENFTDSAILGEGLAAAYKQNDFVDTDFAKALAEDAGASGIKRGFLDTDAKALAAESGVDLRIAREAINKFDRARGSEEGAQALEESIQNSLVNTIDGQQEPLDQAILTIIGSLQSAADKINEVDIPAKAGGEGGETVKTESTGIGDDL